jgi:hypothetical protein
MYTAEKVISMFKTKFPVKKYQDLHLIGGGVYLNIRTKSEATYHRRSKKHEFGFPRVDWDRYVGMVRDGKKLGLIVIEKKTDVLYYARLEDVALHARLYLGDKVDKGGTVFLPRDKFEVKDTLGDC